MATLGQTATPSKPI